MDQAQTVTAYQCDDSGVYVAPIEIHADPLEPGRYLIPRGATEVAPPALQPLQAPRWNGTGWEAIPDFRGVKYWAPNGEEKVVQVAGELVPEGALLSPPASAPMPSVPVVVTRLQAKAALLQAGLLDAANAHFAQAAADPMARLAWAEATTFERDSRLVAATAAALNLSSAQVDDLFRTASEINL